MESEFIKELQELLEKHGASISADDHWEGYSECGQDVRITVEFDDYTIDEIDLGTYIDKNNHGGKQTL